MPRRQQKIEDESSAEAGETAIVTEQAEGGPDVHTTSPVVLRTRSGRRIRTPANLVDSEVPTLKTPSRRTRKAVQEVLISVSACSASDQTIQKECTTQFVKDYSGETNTCPIEPETKKSKIDSNVITRGTEEVVMEPIDKSTGSAMSTQEQKKKLNSDTGHVVLDGSEKESLFLNAVSDSLNITMKKNSSKPKVKPGPIVPLGKPKSGRVWKNRNKQRFSALLRDKPLRSSWEKKMEAKREKELLKKYSQQLKEEKAREKEEKRKRSEENLRRRQENERKAEIVQVIRNPIKMKRMKKKQLRRIEKRDTLALLQKSQPQKQSGGAGKGN